MKPSDIVISNAAAEDYSAIADLLQKVSLPTDGLEAIIPDTLVLKKSKSIIGCGALEIYPPFALLRSVAVEEHYQHLGCGDLMLNAILELARIRGLKSLYLLTETASTFFEKYGFEAINRDVVPESVKGSREFSLICPQSAVAMKLQLA